MKVSSQNNINFKYNKQYHDVLHAKLQVKKKNSHIAQVLAQQDFESLKIEDEIIKMEKNSKAINSVAYNDLVQYYVRLKQNIAFSMSSIFPKEMYAESLIEHYSNEIQHQKNQNAKDWRSILCAMLKEYALPNTNESDYEETFNEDDENLDSDESSETDGNNKTSKKDKKGLELLSLFTPEDSSPKGFCDIVGMEELKTIFEEDVIQPILNPERAKLDEIEYGIKTARNFMLYGPPGCGKTYITQALAMESGLKMYKMDISKIGSRFVNQTSINIESAFEELKKVAKKEEKPILLFMDEVDAIARERTTSSSGSGAEDLKAVTTLLKYVNEARDYNIIIIAATNKFDMLDSAFKSRFAVQKYVGLADVAQIKSLLKFNLSKMSKGQELASCEEELTKLAQELVGYSNRSIVYALDDAKRIARRDGRANISSKHILEAFKQNDYEKINEELYKKTKKKVNKIGISY